MNKFTIPAILVATVLVAGVFALMPVEKASTVHTTLSATQFNEFASAFTNNTSATPAVGGNITATCGSSNAGLVYWTVSNNTMISDDTTGLASTFTIDTDGDTADGGAGLGDGLRVILSANGTHTVSGVVSIAGTTATDFIIGFDSFGTQDIGEMQVTVQCQTGGVAAATVVKP